MAKNKKYENRLLEELKDYDQAVAYLNDALFVRGKGLNHVFSRRWRKFHVRFRSMAA